jgi:hypothetical protein
VMNHTGRTLLVMMGLVIAVVITPPSSAQLVWQDDFEDGNLDGWTVSYGNFTIEDGALTLENDTVPTGLIYHPSTGVVGSWSFKITGRGWGIYFIDTAIPGPNMYGYLLVRGVDRFGEVFYLEKLLNDSGERLMSYRYTGHEYSNQVNITRNINGDFEIYIDNGLVIEETDASIMESAYFIYSAAMNGSALDNVEVVTELYTPPEYPAVFLVGLIATVAIFGVAGVIYRRRVVVVEE